MEKKRRQRNPFTKAGNEPLIINRVVRIKNSKELDLGYPTDVQRHTYTYACVCVINNFPAAIDVFTWSFAYYHIFYISPKCDSEVCLLGRKNVDMQLKYLVIFSLWFETILITFKSLSIRVWIDDIEFCDIRN